jgi:hypothetical protein
VVFPVPYFFDLFSPFTCLMLSLDGLCIHRQETSSIVCLEELEEVDKHSLGGSWLDVKSLFSLCNCRQATRLTRNIIVRLYVKMYGSSICFSGLTLCCFSF